MTREDQLSVRRTHLQALAPPIKHASAGASGTGQSASRPKQTLAENPKALTGSTASFYFLVPTSLPESPLVEQAAESRYFEIKPEIHPNQKHLRNRRCGRRFSSQPIIRSLPCTRIQDLSHRCDAEEEGRGQRYGAEY